MGFGAEESLWTPLRAAPLTLNFSLNQSSDASKTSLWVTREVFHYLDLFHSCRTPHFQMRTTSRNSLVMSYAGSKKKKKKRSAPDQSARIQRAEVSCCSHFNVLNVPFYPGFVRVALAGWGRRASLRAVRVWFSYPVRGFFCCAGEIPASQAPFNRIHSQCEAPTGFASIPFNMSANCGTRILFLIFRRRISCPI